MAQRQNDGQYQPKALFLLRRNIEALLLARKEDQVALARWVGHSKSWINKFLQDDREVQLRDLDKIADFFGITTYQLFQPGISALTERRSSVERRTGRERRIGHNGRLLSGLREELNKVPRLASARGADHGPDVVSAQVASLVADFERRLTAILQAQPREQNASPRRKIANAPKSRRSVRGSDHETA